MLPPGHCNPRIAEITTTNAAINASDTCPVLNKSSCYTGQQAYAAKERVLQVL